MKHHPRKRFGQNFLHDQHVIDEIIRAIAPRADQALVEIGPGRGAITRGLLASNAQLTAIEIDRDLAPQLLLLFNSSPNFKLMEADALNFDFSTLLSPPRGMRIVGNLPYNISTPLIFHLLQYARHIEDMHFMLQKEVVARMAAEPGNRSYGRLSVMLQYHCEVAPLFDVPAGAFYPVPRVESALVRLSVRREIDTPAQDTQALARVVNAAFQQRRKTLRNSLRGIITDEALNSLGIDSRIRAENLSLEDFVNISNYLATRKSPHER